MIGLSILRTGLAVVRVSEQEGVLSVDAVRERPWVGFETLAASFGELVEEVADRDREIAVVVDSEDALVRLMSLPPTVDARGKRRMVELQAMKHRDFVGDAPDVAFAPIQAGSDEYQVGYLRSAVSGALRVLIRQRRLRLMAIRWAPSIISRVAPDAEAFARIADGFADVVLMGERGTTRKRFEVRAADVGWAFHDLFAESRNPQAGSSPINVRRLILDVVDEPIDEYARAIASFAQVEVVGLGQTGITAELGVKPWVLAFGVAAEQSLDPEDLAKVYGEPYALAAVKPFDLAQARSKNVEKVSGDESSSALRVAAIAAVAALVIGGGVEYGRAFALNNGVTQIQAQLVERRAQAARIRQISEATSALRAMKVQADQYAMSGDRLSIELQHLAAVLPADAWLESVQQPGFGRLTVHGYATTPDAWSKLMLALNSRHPEGGYEKQATPKDPVEWQTSISAELGGGGASTVNANAMSSPSAALPPNTTSLGTIPSAAASAPAHAAIPKGAPLVSQVAPQ